MSSLASRLGASLAVSAFLVVVASCGSRTGLFDGTSTTGLLPDARVDGRPDAPNDGPVPCIPGRFDLELAQTQLMFVIDRSRSMRFSLEGRQPEDFLPGDVSRWNILRDALQEQLVPFDQQIAMGAKFYPEEMDEDETDPIISCRSENGVGIAPKLGNAQTIVDVFNNTVPIGGTPTSEALRLGAQFLSASRAAARVMVLATDGAPNCNPDLDYTTCVCTAANGVPCDRPSRAGSCLDDDRTVATITDIFNVQGIPVYVIGLGALDRPEFAAVLDEMAVAGGRPRTSTPRHYNPQSSDEVAETLQTIRDEVAACTFLTPSAPIDPNAIIVQINGITVMRDPTRQNGWDWNDQTYGELAFFGDACDRILAGKPKVTGTVSCQDR